MALTSDQLAVSLKKVVKRCDGNILFFCIGTDRSTGDSLGPLVGTMLKELGYPVIGTLDDPCHAMNLSEHLRSVKGQTIIAIDACLGRVSSVGTYQAGNGPLSPGAGVGKDLPKVGDYHITGIVNVGGFMEYMVLQNTRLSLVMDMAKNIVSAIQTVFPVPSARLEVASSAERLSLRKGGSNGKKYARGSYTSPLHGGVQAPSRHHQRAGYM